MMISSCTGERVYKPSARMLALSKSWSTTGRSAERRFTRSPMMETAFVKPALRSPDIPDLHENSDLDLFGPFVKDTHG